jgi:hypothetical protein
MACQYGQGSVWSRPVPFADYVAYLRGPLAEVGLPS